MLDGVGAIGDGLKLEDDSIRKARSIDPQITIRVSGIGPGKILVVIAHSIVIEITGRVDACAPSCGV
jgi:hypothetical protein